MIIDNKTVHPCSDASVLSQANNFLLGLSYINAVIALF